MSDKLVTGLMLGSLSSSPVGCCGRFRRFLKPKPSALRWWPAGVAGGCDPVLSTSGTLSVPCHSVTVFECLRCVTSSYFNSRDKIRDIFAVICMAHMAHRSTATGWHAVVMLKATS